MEYKKAVKRNEYQTDPAELWLSLGLETSFGET